MTGRPRTFEPDDVLARAMDVFWRNGFEATGITALEEATGLGRQSLYRAFGDKRELFLRVVDYYFDQVIQPGIIAVLDAEGSPRANLERLFDGWVTVASDPEFRGCLVGNAASEMHVGDAEMAAVLSRKLVGVEEAFHRTLARAVAAQEVRADLDVAETARSLVVTSYGLSVVAKVHQNGSFVRSVVDGARRLLD